MENCTQRCNNKQIKVNNKHDEIKATHKTDRYSNDDLKQYNKLDDELKILTLDLQRCIADCKLRNRHRDNTDEVSPVDPDILQELKALEEEEEDLGGGRTRSTIRRRNKRKTKGRQTCRTRRKTRKTRRRRRRRRFSK